jgi:hypothetical protein
MLHKLILARLVRVTLAISALPWLPASGAAQSFNFVSIDVPCSACPGGIARSTTPQGVNPGGDIVGFYVDSVGAQHGFLLSRGNFTTIDVPGALVGGAGVLPTSPRGISPSGEIVGAFTAPVSTAPWGTPAYCPAAGSLACIKGFLYSRGEFSIILFPGHPGAIPQRITPDGTIYGCYHDFDFMASMVGFARTRFGYTSLAAGGGELLDPRQSVLASMDNGATPDGTTIVGLYTDMMAGRDHGFVLQYGNFQPYDPPGSISTRIWDISPEGNFVGRYIDAANKTHGFLQVAADAVPLMLDYPGAVNTVAVGINPGGAIVGQYSDASGHAHGYLAVPR